MNDVFQDMEALVSAILEKNSIELGDAPALISEDVSVSHLELKNKVFKVISILEKEKLPKNICIGLRFSNHINHLIFSLALFKMGIAQTPINPQDVIKVQLNSLNQIDIDLIIQDIPLSNLLKEETVYVNNDLYIQNNIYTNLKENKNLLKSTSIIFLGSGTTGKEKVVVLNSKAFVTQIKNNMNGPPLSGKESFFCYTKLFYHFPLRRSLFALFKKVTLLLPQKRPKDIISFCINHKVNHLLLTGDQALNIVLKNSKTTNYHNKVSLHLKSCTLSSSLINEFLRKSIIESVTKNLFISYGTNEFGNISEALPEDINKHTGSVGKVNSDVTLKILDENAKECEIGEVGTIFVKSYNMANGYLNNPEATKKAFTKDGFCTGDLGRLTQDGHLIIEGRKDDMMIFAGENIYPRELESVLESHPNVIESAVFPLNINNQNGIPFAVAVVSEKMDERELLRWCQEESGWRRPQKIFFTKKLPRNSTGKVLKRILIQQVVEKLMAK